MKFIMKKYRCLLFAAIIAVAGSVSVLATPCCTPVVSKGQEYRLEYQTVTEPVEQTSYKKVSETSYIEEETTTYETVWEPQQRERRYTVARVVPETSMETRRYTVQRPVEETEFRDTSYDVTRMVPETTEREERYLVSKQVYETEQREVIETRKVPITETRMSERLYTVSKPVVSYNTQTVDRGRFVDAVSAVPGRTYHRLAWQPAREYDSATGLVNWQLPGFFWTPMSGETRYTVNKVYQPNYVTETVPVTTMVPEQRIEHVPVTTTSFREEQVCRIENVQVPKTIQEEVVRRVPVTSYKQVVERVQQTTPVKVQRMVSEEKVEEVPVTKYRTITEERVEPYEVKVAKIVPVKKIVRKPVITEKWVPYTYTVERKRVIVNRIPIVNSSSTVIISNPAGSSATPTPRLNAGETLVGKVVDREVPASTISVTKPVYEPTVEPAAEPESQPAAELPKTIETEDRAEKTPSL